MVGRGLAVVVMALWVFPCGVQGDGTWWADADGVRALERAAVGQPGGGSAGVGAGRGFQEQRPRGLEGEEGEPEGQHGEEEAGTSGRRRGMGLPLLLGYLILWACTALGALIAVFAFLITWVAISYSNRDIDDDPPFRR